jgi:hypothetical protein
MITVMVTMEEEAIMMTAVTVRIMEIIIMEVIIMEVTMTETLHHHQIKKYHHQK